MSAMVRIELRLPVELAERLDAQCIDQGRYKTDILTEALTQWLNRAERKAVKP